MGLFTRSNKDGGILNVIRCDEPSYLVWKWTPNGVPTGRENSIRWGSTLRVKEGEVAVFVYKQADGKQMDYFEGPIDTTLKTMNFPVLSSIIGAAYGGDTPFQAEIYFINLAGNVRLPFFINTFDLFDPTPGLQNFAVPCTVQGQMLINITNYKDFIRLHRMINFELDELLDEMRSVLISKIKEIITNMPQNAGIPVIQIERSIGIVNDFVSQKLTPIVQDDFGVNLKRIDISDITIDKESTGYANLFKVTAQQAAEVIQAQTEDTKERMRLGREIDFKRQKLGAETDYFAAHQLNRQADVAEIAAESLGKLGGSMDGGGGSGGSGGGFNPAGMMAGMMLGTAVGSNVAGTLNNTMRSMQMGAMQGGPMQGNSMQVNNMQNMGGMGTPPPPPPPIPQLNLFVAVNGQQTGPFAMEAVQQMVYSRQLTPETLVWKQGMAGWAPASSVPELVPLFSNLPPQL